MSSDIKHWRLNAKVYDDRVEEIHIVSDPARNIRRREQTRVWQVERLLGRGSFGEVRLEKDKEDGQVRAVKRIAMINNTSTSECEKEMTALLEFSKKKYKEAAVFVEFFGWFKHGNNMYLAMEFVHLGDLEKNVIARSGKLPENECRDIAEQILSGLEIMHAESFAHRDLKPQNVLVISGPPQWWVKLADFGLSKQMTDSSFYNTRAGTQSYMAPEILEFLDSDNSGLEYTNAVDIWSAGCIVYRLVTGVVPFPNGRFLVNYCNDKSLFPFDPLFDSDIKSAGAKFIRQLLVPDPDNRPSASQALQSIWILSGSNTPSLSSELSYRPALKEKLGISPQNSSEIIYNTVSHAGLQSYQFMPSNSWGTVLPSPSSPKIPPTPSETALHPYPLPEAPIYTEYLDSRNLSKERGSRQEAPTKETPTTISGPDKLAKQRPGFGKRIDHPPSPMVTNGISKTKRDDGFKGLSASVLKKEGLVCHRVLQGHTDLVSDATFSPDGKVVASASVDKTIQLWDTATGAVRNKIEGHTDPIASVAFSPDGKLIASGSPNGNVRLWDVSTGDLYLTFKGHRAYVMDVAFSPDGKLVASASFDKTIKLWNIAKGASEYILRGHTDYVSGVDFSPGGKIIASASFDRTVRLWNVSEGVPCGTLQGHTGYVEDVAFSSDGRLIASASWDKSVRLWDVGTGAVYLTLYGHLDRVASVAFSPDGRLLVSASFDKTVRLWDTATGVAYCTLEGHKGSVLSVVFSPDGQLLASASRDETVRLWGPA